MTLFSYLIMSSILLCGVCGWPVNKLVNNIYNNPNINNPISNFCSNSDLNIADNDEQTNLINWQIFNKYLEDDNDNNEQTDIDWEKNRTFIQIVGSNNYAL